MIPSTSEGEMMKYIECEKERSGARKKIDTTRKQIFKKLNR